MSKNINNYIQNIKKKNYTWKHMPNKSINNYNKCGMDSQQHANKDIKHFKKIYDWKKLINN
jgi:hypothetical protein